MSLQPALYLLPVSLSNAPIENVLPALNISILRELRVFIVENLRTARRFLREAIPGFDIDGSQFFELNNHTDPAAISSFLEPLRNGIPTGVMSEAGCPGVADPGAQVIEIAQRENLKVIPLVGPSSILMALMGSGFNGQHFCFHGYLPVKEPDKARTLRDLEAESARKDMTQIFIETPYRNNKTIELMSRTLRDRTLVCVASELTDPEKEQIITLPASAWRRKKYDFDKHPTIFLLHAR
ncbi:MAG: SAM-dependent methyltransferase [Bacteroides sp.]|nr:SAM-dependent methyltransferase [Bacteroides sp.]MBD5307099.1 SAM-dependent methyltransferase [Bacteroides sp.]